jgi:tryptophanyl-tRNA synthetase
MKVLHPIQERRRKYEDDPKLAWDILEAGSDRARKAAQETIEQARDAMHMSHAYEAPSANSAQGSK